MESKSRKAIAYVLVAVIALTQTAFTNVFGIDTTMTVTEGHEELTVFSNNIVDFLDLAVVDISDGMSIAVSDNSAVTSTDGDEENATADIKPQDTAQETKENETNKETEEQPQPQTSPFDGKIVVNVDDYLTMRAEPTVDAEIVGKLYAGSMADIVECIDGWTLVTSGSVTGYVCNGYFETGAAAEQLATQVGKRIATVTTDTLRIRSDSNTESDIIDLAAAGQQFTVVGQLEGWYQILYTSDVVGWVSSEFVTVDLTLSQAVSRADELAEIERKAQEEARKAQEEKERREAEEKAERERQEAAQREANLAKQTVPTTTQTAPVESTYDDAYLLACLVSMEAQGESYEGKLAVASVVINRLNSPSYPNTISGVIYQSGQFTGANTGKLASILENGPANSECYQAANDALAGMNNANGYMNFIASWKANTDSYSEYMILGNHCFYRR